MSHLHSIHGAPTLPTHITYTPYKSILGISTLPLKCVISPSGVVVMSINRPAAKNSLSKNLMRLFESHIQSLTEDVNVRAVVLRSVVPKVFCAGADLKERKLMTEEEVPIFVSKVGWLLSSP